MLNQARQCYVKTAQVMLIIFLLLFACTNSFAQTILFQDDFSSGNADRWHLMDGWQVVSDEGNYVLRSSQPSVARAGSILWKNYSLTTRVKFLTNNSNTSIMYRDSGSASYGIAFGMGGLSLNKSSSCCPPLQLARASGAEHINQWYTIKIVTIAENIKVYVDDLLKIDFTDSAPLLNGAIAFIGSNNSIFYFDDVLVVSDEPVSATPWKSTGGPLGGIGYDVRIHPEDKSVMYVTDNFAGVLRSDNGGQTWTQKNDGITLRTGTTGDAVNIFCLTVDPNNPDIIWSGTNADSPPLFGVYKSTNGGTTWTSKSTGMTLSGESGMTFRGFTIQQGNSNIVYAQAEIPTTQQGRVKGRVYKTSNGGANWELIWQGDNLARYLIVDPGNTNVLYLSTGIFDREAFNSDCANGAPGGLGVLKSIDGGQTWTPINNGLSDLYVCCLRMHPTNPQILFAATGNGSCSKTYANGQCAFCGVFKTINGGSSWTKVISNEFTTTVNFSPSNPDTIYAGGPSAFYRSQDGGTTWSRFSKPRGQGYGPPGILAGQPIDVTVDPDNSFVIYANNYGGGVFRSIDGAENWEMWSKGYSGAMIQTVHIPAADPSTVYALGNSGPFASSNYGEDWVGIAKGDAESSGNLWNSIATKPTNSKVLLISPEGTGEILISNDGGNTFSKVLKHPDVNTFDPNKLQGFRGLAFAPSSPNLVYAGISRTWKTCISSSPIGSISPLGTVIYKSQDGGMSFAPMPSALDGTNVRRLVVDPTNADIVYAATSNGVYITKNGAVSWIRIESLGSKVIEAIAINPLQPGYIIAGEVYGGIWMSTNGGINWTGPLNTGFSSPNPFITSVVVDPVNPNTVFAGDFNSGVYRSLDKGATWAAFPDWKMSGLTVRAVEDLAINASVLYAGTFGGGVFRFDRTPKPTSTACTATLNGNLLLHIPYISYVNPVSGSQSIWADLVYEPNPTYPELIPFKLTNYGAINNPSFSCAASTLSADFKIHIPDVLLPDGITHIWVDLAYSPALSIDGKVYFFVSNYGVVSN